MLLRPDAAQDLSLWKGQGVCLLLSKKCRGADHL